MRHVPLDEWTFIKRIEKKDNRVKNDYICI